MASMINEGEWSSMSGIYNSASEEPSDIMVLLNDCSANYLNDHHIGVDSCWSNNNDHEDTTMDMGNALNFSDIYNGSDNIASNNYHFSGFSHENNNYYANDENAHQYLGMSNFDNFGCLNTGIIMGTSFHVSQTDDMIDINECLIGQESEHHRHVSGKLSLHEADDIGKSNISKSKKRSLNHNVSKVEKSKRNVKSKKNVKLVASCDKINEGKNAAINKQNSSSCSSEDYCSEITEGMTSTKGSLAQSSNGKTRASRGSATDPQSLYARKRRERINERLRILQNLVPNGTKVDMSTMLEEAVQYVKFLQLQIKLLSSDDNWMYAPLAYNGMDIGLDLKINMLNNLRR